MDGSTVWTKWTRGGGATAKLLGRSGGYRRLLSYQVARLTYDVTVRFCDRYVSKRSRTHDQMVQAARRRCQSADEVAERVRQVACTFSSTTPTPSTPSIDWARYAECSANAGHTLACVAFGLVDRQLGALAERFEREGGFTERMYRVRKERLGSCRA